MTRGYLAEKTDTGLTVTLTDLDRAIPELNAPLATGEVELAVEWSGINYKDALLLTGSPGIARTSPLVPGIDVVGRVTRSHHPDWAEGTPALIAGAGLGESRHGGLAERVRVPGDLLIRIPDGLEPRDAAALGTAGFTAGLAVRAISAHSGRLTELDGPVLVTGANGGAGGIALMLLAAGGADVVALTGGGDDVAGELRRLGAQDVLPRETLAESDGKPLQRERWAAVVDAVGGPILANAIAQTRREGIVTAFGMAAATSLPTTVLPFILRGVTLRGINSVEQPQEVRRAVWDELAQRVPLDELRRRTHEVALEDAVDAARTLLAGGSGGGRTVVRVGA